MTSIDDDWFRGNGGDVVIIVGNVVGVEACTCRKDVAPEVISIDSDSLR